MSEQALAKAQAKVARQAQELARLRRQVEQLHADKAGLLFDLNKLRAKLAQMERKDAG